MGGEIWGMGAMLSGRQVPQELGGSGGRGGEGTLRSQLILNSMGLGGEATRKSEQYPPYKR